MEVEIDENPTHHQDADMEGIIQEMHKEDIRGIKTELENTKIGVVLSMDKSNIVIEGVYYSLWELQPDIIEECRQREVAFMGNTLQMARGEPPALLYGEPWETDFHLWLLLKCGTLQV